MKRFILKALLISLAATVAWWFAAPWTRPHAIATAKLLHTLVGYPAPYLLADLDDYYWFAPLFPPLVGLVLASHWVSWRRRIGGLLIGLCAFWYLVALQIAILYSPYLTLSAARAYLVSGQIALNTVVVPVVLWLIVIGGPPAQWETATSRPPDDATRAMLTRIALVSLLFCFAVSLPLPLATSQTTATLSAARNATARAIAAGNETAAMESIETMFTVQQHNAALSYLLMELHRRRGHTDTVAQLIPSALQTPRRRAVYRRLWSAGPDGRMIRGTRE